MPVQTTYPVSFNHSGIDHTFELQENYVQDGLPAFQFRKRNGEINWRKLSALDVERVARELDFVTLQENISTVTFCNIDAVSDVDPLVVKLFKLAQFIVEYLLHSQEYLQSVVQEYEAKIEDGAKCNETLQQKINELNDDVAKLKEENKKRRRMIQQQQMLIEAGASSYYQCPHCEKAFMNVSFLQGHMQRRHPGSVNYIGDVIAHSQREQSKLGKQLTQLEDELKTERNTFNSRLQKAEEEKKKWTEESQRQMDEWKEQEEMRMKEQMESMRASFLEDIDKMKKKEASYQKKIAGLEKTMDQRQSNLGDLVDDLEGEKLKLREYEDRVVTLEELNDVKNQQIADLTNTMRQLRHDSTRRDEQDERMMEEQNLRMAKLEKQFPSKHRMERVRKVVEEVSAAVTSDDSDVSPPAERLSRSEEIKAIKEQFKTHLKSLLDEKLRSSGVDPEATRLSSNVLRRKLMVLKAERKQTADQIPEFYQIRESTRRNLAEEVRRQSRASKGSRGGGRSSQASLTQKSRTRLSEKQPISSARSRKPIAEKNSSEADLRSSRLYSPSPSRTKQVPARTRTPPSQRPKESRMARATSASPRASVRKPTTPTPVPRTHKHSVDDDDVSDWDTELDDDDDDKVTVVEPNVKSLAKKLETNLSARKKPPVGAVDVSPQLNTKVEEFHSSEFDDDDDSFLVSSLEEEKKDQRPSSSRAPASSNLRQSAASTSSNTFGTSVWGSGQKATRSDERDEFDSDELDIDDLMT